MKYGAICMLISIAFVSNALAAQPDGEIAGKPRVLDGDTLSYSIRIYGVDTPETRQVCADSKGRCYRCGEGAADFLHDLLRVQRSGQAGKSVSCEFTGDITYGRPVASCEVGGKDIGEALIKAGWAYAYTSYLSGPLKYRYVNAENDAKQKKKGIWQGDHVSPSAWRNEGERVSCKWN
jgi:endonuclease YncB( thermonuclease family)